MYSYFCERHRGRSLVVRVRFSPAGSVGGKHECHWHSAAPVCRTVQRGHSTAVRFRSPLRSGRCNKAPLAPAAPRYEHLASVFWTLTCDACKALGEARPSLVLCSLSLTTIFMLISNYILCIINTAYGQVHITSISGTE